MSKSEQNCKSGKSGFTSSGPESVELAVYQQGGTAVVREERAVTLEPGANQVYMEGMPTQYQPSTLTVLDYDGAEGLTLGPISYRGANLDKQRVLLASVGARVTVKEVLSNGRVNNIGGKLLAVLGNEVAVERGDNKRVMLVPANNIELDEGIPAGLSSTPSLTMTPSAVSAGCYRLRLLYEAGGLAWAARYSLFFDEKRSLLTRFEASVALTNGSGASFTDALVRLVAGSNYARGNRGMMLEAAMMPMAAPAGGGRARAHALGAVDASVESVGDLKVYSLPKQVTIRDGEHQQATLLLAHEVPVKKEYFLGAGYYAPAAEQEDGGKLPVFIRLRLVNEKDSKLGAALPAGEVNIFQNDSSGSPQKVGSTALGHVAEGEKFKVEFGPSADIKAVRRLVEAKDFEQPKPQEEEADTFREEERELTVFNFKGEAVEVLVSESIPHQAEWLKRPEGHELTEDAPGAATLRVKVEPRGKTTLRYRLRYRTN